MEIRFKIPFSFIVVAVALFMISVRFPMAGKIAVTVIRTALQQVLILLEDNRNDSQNIPDEKEEQGEKGEKGEQQSVPLGATTSC